mmetsp:Transcript_11172/g.24924  ORF Transcript_11172/g.24924 Transcript_11172/m.24924 type:complete len:219 (-) Transcript_11172:443-1099(-)
MMMIPVVEVRPVEDHPVEVHLVEVHPVEVHPVEDLQEEAVTATVEETVTEMETAMGSSKTGVKEKLQMTMSAMMATGTTMGTMTVVEMGTITVAMGTINRRIMATETTGMTETTTETTMETTVETIATAIPTRTLILPDVTPMKIYGLGISSYFVRMTTILQHAHANTHQNSLLWAPSLVRTLSTVPTDVLYAQTACESLAVILPWPTRKMTQEVLQN